MAQVPTIRRDGLSPEEADHALSLERNLHTLAELAEEFEHSHFLSLNSALMWDRAKEAGDSKRQSSFRAWEKIAARNGAIVAYSFQEVVQALNTHIAERPGFHKLLDKAVRRDADKVFKETFPQITKTRTTAAHPGEFHSTKVDYDKHSVKGKALSFGGVNIHAEEGTFFVADILSRNGHMLTFAATVLGVLVSYDLSPATVQGIKQAANLYWRALQATDYYGQLPFPVQEVGERSQ